VRSNGVTRRRNQQDAKLWKERQISTMKGHLHKTIKGRGERETGGEGKGKNLRLPTKIGSPTALGNQNREKGGKASKRGHRKEQKAIRIFRGCLMKSSLLEGKQLVGTRSPQKVPLGVRQVFQRKPNPLRNPGD